MIESIPRCLSKKPSKNRTDLNIKEYFVMNLRSSKFKNKISNTESTNSLAETEGEIFSSNGYDASSEPLLKSKKGMQNISREQIRLDETKLDNVIINSNLQDNNPLTQAKNVLAAFNIHVDPNQSAFESSLFVGQWVHPEEYILGACNQIPELKFYDGSMKIRRAWYASPTINAEVLSTHQQSQLFFGAYGSFVLNVPVNKLAKGWSGNTPFLYNTGPHVIHDANFKFFPQEGLVDQNDPYINHGSIHILRVPAGMIAKIWIGATPYLLESREEAYVFNTALFKLSRRDNNNLFFSATDELIIHGSIKRVMPRTGREAVTYNNGNLEIIKPSEKGVPTILNSATHEVSSFIDTNVQAYTFPSAEEKQRRHVDNPHISADELNNYVYTTKDSQRIGVKLLVSYRITDSHKTLSQLGENKILSTVESLAAVDMGKMISRLSGQEFLSPYSANQSDKNKAKSMHDEEIIQPSFWDDIRENLTKELSEYGIELRRFASETPVVLDKEIAKKMAEYAIMTAEANAKQAIIQRQAQVQEAEANRDAKTKQIEQDQINTAIVSNALAAFKAQEHKANGMLIEAKAKAEAINIIGNAYKNNPEVLELEKVKLVSEAMGKMNMLVPFPTQPIEHVMNPGSYASFGRFFGGAKAGPELVNEVVETKAIGFNKI